MTGLPSRISMVRTVANACLLALLLSHVRLISGFLLPARTITTRTAEAAVNWAASPGQSRSKQIAQPSARRGNTSNTGRDRRPCFERHVVGPDGKEIDIRAHREANSFVEYWEHFYAGGEAGELDKGDTYDWFFNYSKLAVYLNMHIGGAREGRVLVLGCGNSEVSPKMWEAGWKNIVNIDFCRPVIEAMEKAHADKRGMEWRVMDARDMSELETGSFDAVIDKGLTNSIMYNDKFRVMVAQTSLEVARVLKPGGVFLLTDYRDPEWMQDLFTRDEWKGGSITHEGKITSTMNLFKGKRTDEEAEEQFALDAGGSGQG